MSNYWGTAYLQKTPDGKLFADIFGIGGLYYQIFTDGKLLVKLQALDLVKVEAFFMKLKSLNLSDAEKVALQGDLLSSEAFLTKLVNDEKLLSAWNILKENNDYRKVIPYLENIGKNRSNGIYIELEEYLGGHSIERHGFQIPIQEMEQRILGTHPTMPQSRSALKFDNEAIHKDPVSKAYTRFKTEIDDHFINGDKSYFEKDFDYGSRIGDGYYNSGTRGSPVSNRVTTTKIRIAFKENPNHPTGYIMDSAYPLYEP